MMSENSNAVNIAKSSGRKKKILVGIIFPVVCIIFVTSILGVFGATKLFKQEVYVVDWTFGFSTTQYIKIADENGKEELVTVIAPYNEDKYDAESLNELLKTDVVISLICSASENRYDEERIRAAVSVESTGTNNSFYNFYVMDDDAQFCEIIADVIIDVFPDYLRSVNSTLGIRIVNYPGKARIEKIEITFADLIKRAF